MKERFTTIKDVAKSLNISVSTVSRALRDTYDINEETRKRVLKKVSELNYKPNYSARGLAQGRTCNIGIILPLVTNYYFSTVITGIQEEAYKRGYNIILFLTDDSPEKEFQIIQNLPIGSFDGLLISTSFGANTLQHYQNVIKEGYPIVFFDRIIPDIETSRVLQDDFNGAYQATKHLIIKGYKKIAHITGPKGLTITQKRIEGYKAALYKYGLPIKNQWIIHSGFSQPFGEIDTEHLLQQKEIPDAIFAVNDRKAIGSIVVLKKRGIKIGKEFGVVGFTNDPMSLIVSPTLTTIVEPALEIGMQSCKLLLKHLTKKYFVPEEVVLPGQLLVRESTLR